MTEAAKNKVFSFRRRAENERDEELRALREGLIWTRTLINQAHVGFNGTGAVAYTHLRAHETRHEHVCRLLLEKKKTKKKKKKKNKTA